MGFLTILAATGLLLIKSEPAGANIVIDGVANGETPRLVTHLDAAYAHKVSLRKAGYQTTEFTVRFDGRTPVLVNHKLVLDAGVITVNSEPAGASVTLNGQDWGVTPVTIPRVPKGRSTIKLKLKGFRDVVEGISVSAGDDSTLNYVLEGLPGTLALTSVPSGARFYVNGEPKGQGPLVLPGLEGGKYTVRAELAGYAPEEREVEIDAGGSKAEEFVMSNTMGRLEVRTSPGGAQIILDGRNLGTTAAKDDGSEFSNYFHIPNVMEGEHTLVVRKDGYKEKVVHPKIKSGKTAQRNIRLERVFIPNVEVVTTTGTLRCYLHEKTDTYVTVEVSLGNVRSIPMSDVTQIKPLDR